MYSFKFAVKGKRYTGNFEVHHLDGKVKCHAFDFKPGQFDLDMPYVLSIDREARMWDFPSLDRNGFDMGRAVAIAIYLECKRLGLSI